MNERHKSCGAGDQLLRDVASEIGRTVETVAAVGLGRSQDLALFTLERVARSTRGGGLPPQATALAAQLRKSTMFVPVLAGELAAGGSYWTVRASLGLMRTWRTRFAAWR
jgi:hypothetical protein